VSEENPATVDKRDSGAVVDTKAPDSTALAIAFYTAARAEVVQRIVLRDTTMLAWITTSGVLLGLAVKDSSENSEMRLRIAEFLPALSFAFGLAVYRHTYIMELISQYFSSHLNVFLHQDKGIELIPRHWDNSFSLRTRIRIYLSMELFAYFLLMTSPAIVCIHYLWAHNVRFQSGWFWEACVCTSLLILILGAKIFQTRRFISRRSASGKRGPVHS